MPAPSAHPQTPPRVTTPKKQKPVVRSDRGIALLPPLLPSSPLLPPSPILPSSAPSFVLSASQSSPSSLHLSTHPNMFSSHYTPLSPPPSHLSSGTLLELAEAHERVKAAQLGTAGVRTLTSFVERNKVVASKFRQKHHHKTDRAAALREKVLYGGRARELEGGRADGKTRPTEPPLGGAPPGAGREQLVAEAKDRLEALHAGKAAIRARGLQFYERAQKRESHLGGTHTVLGAVGNLLHVDVSLGAIKAGVGNLFAHAESPSQDHGKKAPAEHTDSVGEPKSASPLNDQKESKKKSFMTGMMSAFSSDHGGKGMEASSSPSSSPQSSPEGAPARNSPPHHTGLHFENPFASHHVQKAPSPDIKAAPKPLLPLSTYKRYNAELQRLQTQPQSPHSGDPTQLQSSPDQSSPPPKVGNAAGDSSHHPAESSPSSPPPSDARKDSSRRESPTVEHPPEKKKSSPSSWWGGSSSSPSSATPGGGAAADPHSSSPLSASAPPGSEPAKKGGLFGGFHVPAVHLHAPKLDLHLPDFHLPKLHLPDLHLPNLHILGGDKSDDAKHPHAAGARGGRPGASAGDAHFSYRAFALGARASWRAQPSAREDLVRAYVWGCLKFGLERASERLAMRRHVPFEDEVEGPGRGGESSEGLFALESTAEPFLAGGSVYKATLQDLFSSTCSSPPLPASPSSSFSLEGQENFWAVVERSFFVAKRRPATPPPPPPAPEIPAPAIVAPEPRVKRTWRERATWLDEAIRLHNDNYGGGEGQGGDGGKLRTMLEVSGFYDYRRPEPEPDWLKRGTAWAERRTKNAKGFAKLTSSENKVLEHLKEDLCRKWDLTDKKPSKMKDKGSDE